MGNARNSDSGVCMIAEKNAFKNRRNEKAYAKYLLTTRTNSACMSAISKDSHNLVRLADIERISGRSSESIRSLSYILLKMELRE